ncbi:hypothetical protein B9Z65_6868 [Elsinoe australis]|uniref:Uncharacterized protein n=1 Tax=Elsinoe australis TaxID=40998 RepID=A0A2P7Z3Y6_9PEZI|nr:hypothetical protein B9Z65_6868 [Elsinoe australis]
MSQQSASIEAVPCHVSLVEFSSSRFDRPGTFNFAELHPELRLMIYKFVFGAGYSSIENFISAHLGRIQRKEHDPRTQIAPSATRTSPGILTVCKWIYEEAITVLNRHTLYFHHGLLDLKLHPLIHSTTLRNIRHLVVTDDGHNVMDKVISCSFNGHKRLVVGLGNALMQYGHQLETLELHFTDTGLKFHLDNCWNAKNGCDIRPWMTAVYNTWKVVRGIRSVKIYGWMPDHMKTSLINLMQSSYHRLDRLPFTILRQILNHSCALSSVSDAINAANSEAVVPRTSTPNIFLISRLSSYNFAQFVREPPFVLDFRHPPRAGFDQIHNYISEQALRTLPSLRIHIRHRNWMGILQTIATDLSAGHSLKKFELIFEDDRPLPGRPNLPGFVKVYPDWRLEFYLNPLKSIKKVPNVHFGGDLARVIHGAYLRDLYKDMTGRESPIRRPRLQVLT